MQPAPGELAEVFIEDSLHTRPQGTLDGFEELRAWVLPSFDRSDDIFAADDKGIVTRQLACDRPKQNSAFKSLHGAV